MAKTEVDKILIRELAALMEEAGLCEIDIRNHDQHMRLVRPTSPIAAAVPFSAPTQPNAHTPAGSASVQTSDISSHPGAVTSPLVGTAYHAPSPEAPPFVNVGDKVSTGQTLLVIEAMKTFNEIPAPSSGIVKQILFDNAAPVEYGDVLMIVE